MQSNVIHDIPLTFEDQHTPLSRGHKEPTSTRCELFLPISVSYNSEYHHPHSIPYNDILS